MKIMKCPSCQQMRETHKGGYHYTESGLPNVWLRGVEIFECDCGEKSAFIPCIEELHKLIGKTLIVKEEQLSGSEIRFLRKHMMLKSKDFAKELGVQKVTMSRWENSDSQPSESVDRLIRLVYAIKMGLSKTDKTLVMDKFRNLRKGHHETKLYSFPARLFVKRSCVAYA
ncbi:MAG: type II TA system antitoxin MqsA family protein [Desulfobaccales bacterium]